MVRVKVCPCGARLQRKWSATTGRFTETEKQFEDRRYCNAQCAGRYRPKKPAHQGFGFEVPRDKSRQRLTTGARDYFDGSMRPVPA